MRGHTPPAQWRRLGAAAPPSPDGEVVVELDEHCLAEEQLRLLRKWAEPLGYRCAMTCESGYFRVVIRSRTPWWRWLPRPPEAARVFLNRREPTRVIEIHVVAMSVEQGKELARLLGHGKIQRRME